jgi:adenylosuccinate lyase
MATENILMEAVKKGADRQQLHERIRVYSMEAVRGIKTAGKENDLLQRITSDPAFHLNQADLDALFNASDFVGRAPEQVSEFIKDHVDVLLEKGKKLGSIKKFDVKV